MLTPTPIARSGTIASGQVGWPHHASGAVRSGHLSVTGTPDGTRFLRDDFSWQMIAAGLMSGDVSSGYVASGTVAGFFGPTRHIQSGTIGVFDFGSGAVIAGSLGSGAVVSGNVASGQIGRFHIASGSLLGFELGSGSIVSGRIASGQIGFGHLADNSVQSGTVASGVIGAVHLADSSVTSGDVASGQVGRFHLSSGAVNSGHLNTTGTPDGTLFLRDDFVWSSPIVSGSVSSGDVSSGSVGGFFAPTRHIQSGTVGVFDLGSGAVVATTIGSGAVVSGNVASGQIGTFHLSDNVVVSGKVASGAIIGQAGGGPFNIASGTVGSFDIGSGAVVSGRIASGQIGFGHLANSSVQSGTIASGIVGSVHLADGAVTSGDVSSGQIGWPHLASGAVRSGHLGTTGTPDATKFLDGTFTWSTPGAASIGSGDVNSGKIASGAVQGFFGSTRHIASGTLGVFDFGSGAVIATTIGSGAVVSGNVASGQIGFSHLANSSVQSGTIASGHVDSHHFASGDVVSRARQGAPYTRSGLAPLPLLTEEAVSGVRAVHVSQSGHLRIAMASVSGRMPAIGVVFDNVSSGEQATIYNWGAFEPTSGLIGFSGLAETLYVGRSGQIVTRSGWFNSGGFQVGDWIQSVGVLTQSGRLFVGAAVPTQPGISLILSGDIASGIIGSVHLADNSVTSGDIASGAVGRFHLASVTVHSGHVASGAIIGQAGGGPFNIASGTITTNDIGSGAIVSGLISSGQVGFGHLANSSVQSGTIASGIIGTVHLADGAVTSGDVSSGQIGWPHLASGAVRSGHLSVTGTPDGSKFLRDDFSWQTAGGGLTSGAVQSGHVASGTVAGFFGATRHVQSGTVGVFDLGSGAVIATTIGSGAVVSGNVASGQIGFRHLANSSVQSGTIASGAVDSHHFASGDVISRARQGAPYTRSGLTPIPLLTEESISGVRAVYVSQSGQLGIAMASVSGRMPAIGVVFDNVSSGEQATIYNWGAFEPTSGLIGHSGLNQTLYVGRSGHLVSLSGWFNSGGFVAGDWIQALGVITQSGRVYVGIAQSWQPATAQILSGDVASGQIGRFHIASGSLLGFELGSGSIVSGRIASGQIGTGHLADGAVTSGDISSGSVSWAHLASDAVRSGHVASGAVTGQAGGGNFGIASGSVGSFDLASGSVVSGRIASGQIGTFHLANDLIASGKVASGAIIGQAGGGPFNVASGTIGRFDLASGSVVSGTIASGQIGTGHLADNSVTSGDISSGQVSTYHGASGAIFSHAQELAPLYSGTLYTALTRESVSGTRAVAMSPSGTIWIAMASVSGRMPAIGVVYDNVASGIQANVHCVGAYQFSSGMADYSGYLGQLVFVGRSGQIVTHSGSFNSGGLLSGDIWQPAGVAFNSGAVVTQIGAQLPFSPQNVNTIKLWMPMGELVSGVKAVAWNVSGGYSVVRAERASGLRLPAIGVTISGAVSGTIAEVVTYGVVYGGVSGMIASGFHGQHLYVGSGGLIVNRSGFMGGSSSGDPFLSGNGQQVIGFSISGGTFVDPVKFPTRSGFYHTLAWLV